VLLALGLATALFGVVFAAVQVDMKRPARLFVDREHRLLFAGIGLALIFSAYAMSRWRRWRSRPRCTHVASHALFKSLLFLSTGCVLHATGRTAASASSVA
jgi:formate hydrogenlyase subunit 3/multisubunit Na+/H+ antiporter MnhD subunit